MNHPATPMDSPILLPRSVAPERWGYLRPDGSWAMPPQFAFAWPFSEGVAAVRKGDRMGYLRPDGDPAFPDRFETASPFDNGIAWCEAKGGRWGPFLREGRFLVPPIYDDPGWESGPFLSGRKSGDELENWFDRAGRIVVPAAPASHADSAEGAKEPAP